jgi:hypothetical protein
MEKCIQEKEINRLSKIIEGNGQPGLLTQVAQISEKVNTIHNSIEKIEVHLGTLLDFKAETTGIRKYGRYVNTTIIAISSIIVAIILKYL